MNSTVPAVFGRLRHFWLEAGMAVGLTLTVVTAAYATAATIPPRVEALPRVAAPVVPPAPPPPLFVFGEPVPGQTVNSPFGLRRMPWEKHGRLHEGVDISAPSGLPVLAVADGVITRAGNSPTYGRFVEVRHAEGLVSFYAHLGRIDRSARPGVAVKSGATLARIGSSGTSTGPHLHFEIRQDDRPLNPTAFIGRQFATADDLPVETAALYPRRVRIAQVSAIPGAKRALMDTPPKAGKDARVSAKLEVAPRAPDTAAVEASAPEAPVVSTAS